MGQKPMSFRMKVDVIGFAAVAAFALPMSKSSDDQMSPALRMWKNSSLKTNEPLLSVQGMPQLDIIFLMIKAQSWMPLSSLKIS